MHASISKFMVTVAALAFTIAASASDRWETLRAINWVENPTNQTHAGRFGELGPYQFRPTTWKMHTDKPFSLAVQRDVADEVAVKHYEWIKHNFEQAGIEPNVFNIALAWNCGVDAVVRGRAPSVSYAYAERVTNLVETFEASAQATAAAVSHEETPLNVAMGDEQLLHFRVADEDTPHFVIAAN